MLIDWFTVGAQAANFLILVWLMKRFLYQPILRAIDSRETRVAAELADADAKQAEAKKERDEFQHKNEDLDQQRAGLLKQATDEAKTERKRLLDEARKAAADVSAKRQEALRNEAQTLNREIAARAREEVFAIARKTLADLAGASLEERMAGVFTQRLRELDTDAKSRLADALKSASNSGLVRTAFELPQEQRTLIQTALNETSSADIQLRFETVPEVVSGIEFTAAAQKVAWSIADYLTALQSGVDELLKAEVRPQEVHHS